MHLLKYSLAISLLMSVSNTALSQDLSNNSYFRLRPPDNIIVKTDGNERSAALEIRANPGNWRENDFINFPVNLYPHSNAEIYASGLPGSIEYNKGLSAFVGQSTSGSAPYETFFTIYAKGLSFLESKQLSIKILPELQASITSVPEARVGQPFSLIPSYSGIVGTATWTSSEIIGNGLSLNSETGEISGVPLVQGSISDIQLTVEDSSDNRTVSTTEFDIEIASAEIKKEIASGVSLSIRDYFTEKEWTSNVPKVATIPQNSIVGSLDVASPALSTGANWGGALTLHIQGEVQGAGGGANGGNGGDAILVEDSRISILNDGAIRAGGGGGGKGGDGGQGSVSTQTMVQEPAGGGFTFIHGNTYIENWNGRTVVRWYGSIVVDLAGTSVYPPSQGGWTYYSQSGRIGSFTGVRRERMNTSYNYYNGTPGTAGGQGRGFNQFSGSGTNPSSASNNAGNGGTGGAGGDWGLSGHSGQSGASGNSAAGTDGLPGGLAGRAINGFVSSIVGVGTIQGR